MNSPRYAPAGLLVECGTARVMIDGGRGRRTKIKGRGLAGHRHPWRINP
jgi:hypothetical protein